MAVFHDGTWYATDNDGFPVCGGVVCPACGWCSWCHDSTPHACNEQKRRPPQGEPMSHPHRSTHGLGKRTAASRTRADLLKELEEREAEAETYLSMLVPLLVRLGGQTVVTIGELTAIPDGATVWREQHEPGAVRIGLTFPSEPA